MADTRWIRILGIGILLTGFLWLGPAVMADNQPAPSPINWKELKGTHFLIYYQNKDTFAKQVLERAERYYHQVSEDLGYARYDQFWQWENRVKIYVYPTKEDYWRETQEPVWSQGVADYAKKTIKSYEWTQGFTDALLPHEITHLVFRDYVGFKGEIALWLDEGIAQWEEPAKRAIVKQVMRDMLQKGEHFPMKDLTGADVRKEESPVVITRFYIQAASVIDFMIKEFGSARFVQFCRQLRDGKALEEALGFAYPTQIRNVNEMEEKWKDYILKEEKK